MNATQSAVYNTWYILGGYPQPGGYSGCPFPPTPSPTTTPTNTPTNTTTPTNTPTNTQTPTPSPAFCNTYTMDPDPIATWIYVRCDGTSITRTGETTTYTECLRNNTYGYLNPITVLSGTLNITNLGPCA
jgi:hypothetical protein